MSDTVSDEVTTQVSPEFSPPAVPANAYIRYETCDRAGYIVSHETEEQARSFAAHNGNGSGKIMKKTKFLHYYEASEKFYGTAQVSLTEELEPVTAFFGDGAQAREHYLAKRACTHEDTHTVSSGAGCSYDVDVVCSFCGKHVG